MGFALFGKRGKGQAKKWWGEFQTENNLRRGAMNMKGHQKSFRNTQS